MGKTELLENLRKTIEQDPTYFVKAKTDINLNGRPEIESLLNRLHLNASNIAKKSIETAEAMLDNFPQEQLEDVCEAVYDAEIAFQVSGSKGSVLASRTMYENIQNEIESAKTKIEFAKEKVATGNYIAFLEAKSIADESYSIAKELSAHAKSAISQTESEMKYYNELRKEKVKFAWNNFSISSVIVFGILGLIFIGPNLEHYAFAGEYGLAPGEGMPIGFIAGLVIGFIYAIYNVYKNINNIES